MKTFAPDLIAVSLATLATCASAGVFDDAPPTRAEVRAQYLEAQKNGDLVVGENGETARDLNPGAYPARQDQTDQDMQQPAPSPRGQVREADWSYYGI